MAKVFLITSHYMGVLFIEELLKSGDEITGVAAWPDAGGWYVPVEYDVRTKAFQNYLPLYEPDPKKLNSEEFLNVIRGLKPDFIVSGYYSQLFGSKLMAIPPGGCVNIHPTGLPRFRGLSPYFTHMLFGDEFNYITMHWLDNGADTGDIIAQASVKILPDDTGYTCGHRLTEAGAGIFKEYWPAIKAGKAPRQKQDASKASVFNYSGAMAEIDWKKEASEIRNLIRSISKPLNGAWTRIGGQKLIIWKAETADLGSEVNIKASEPGTLAAIDGNSLWVQCGKGQLRIIDAELEGGKTNPFGLLNEFGKNYRIMLG
ncbi:MAG: methionyl-tRNA formyltransferase [Actinomycetota bacterium]